MAGGGGGKGAPAPPNFNAAATPDQTNAFGVSSKWGQGYDEPVPDWVTHPDTGGGALLAGSGGHNPSSADAWKQQHSKYSQTQSFNGPLAGAATGLQQQLADAWKTPLTNGADARNSAENAIYGRETSRLDPMWNQREGALTTSLANQGLDPTSEAAQKSTDTFNRGRNDAYTSALQESIMGGGQEATRQQGLDLTSRMAPLGALAGLGGLTGQSQNPLLPAAMAQYQGALQKYGIDQQGKNSTLSGLTNAGGTVGAAALM
jgi:hypothetical protein